MFAPPHSLVGPALPRKDFEACAHTARGLDEHERLTCKRMRLLIRRDPQRRSS